MNIADFCIRVLSSGLLGSACQAVMLLLMISEIYVIRKLRGYRGTAAWQGELMALCCAELVLSYLMLLDKQDMTLYFTASTLAATLITFILYRFILKWRENRLSVDTIKEGLDDLPVGVCFYGSDGRPVLMNNRINKASSGLTGESLRDGNIFWEQVINYNRSEDAEHPIGLLSDGSVMLFRKKEGGEITEITATDITDAYGLSEKLKKENEDLRTLNLRLREYNKNIEELTREREILETRVHIHDDYGRMLLMAKRSLQEPENTELRRDTLKVWNENSELFSGREALEKQDMFKEIKKVAATVGVNVLYSGDYPESAGETADIFINALHECITNTVKHAGGNELYVVFTRPGRCLRMECQNNGKLPEGEIIEGGGLSSLRKRVEAAGGRMTIYGRPHFSLTIELENRQ